MTAPLKDIDQAVALLEATDNFRILRRLTPKTVLSDHVPQRIGRGIVLDTETTGKDAKNDKLIEIALVSFEYDADLGIPTRIDKVYNGLRDPGIPIPPEATAVNGITDEMVKGKVLDDDEITEMVLDADLLIAHNALYDRQVCEGYLPIFQGKPWACSLHQIPWADEGVSSAKLEFIAMCLGFYYNAHRADVDCYALLEAISRPLPSGQRGLNYLLEAVHKKSVDVWAMGTKFEVKDKLSGRQYRFADGTNGTERAWHKDISREDLDAEIAWLRENVYSNRPFHLIQDQVDAFTRFSGRRGGTKSTYH